MHTMVQHPKKRRVCGCGCGELVAKSTENRHLIGQAPRRILVAQFNPDAPPSKRQRTTHPLHTTGLSKKPAPTTQASSAASESATFGSATANGSDGPADAASATLHWNRVTVEEVDDDDGEFRHVGAGWIDDGDEAFAGEEEEDDDDDEVVNEGLHDSVDEMLERFEQEMAEIGGYLCPLPLCFSDASWNYSGAADGGRNRVPPPLCLEGRNPHD